MNFTGGTKLKLTVPGHAAGADNILATIEAVKASDDQTACIAAFKNVSYPAQYSCSYSKPKSGTLPLSLGDKTLSCATGGKASIDTAFNENGAAQLAFKYPDAGELTIAAVINDAKGVATGEGKAVTAPASFRIEPATGTIRAGADFALQITALNAAGAVTPNFDNKDLNDALAIKHSVTLAVACHKQGGSTGTVTPAAPAFSDGVASVNASWSDVGQIDLSANLSDFLGTGLGATGTTNTLGAGKCSGNVGPFIPAYYRLTLSDSRTWYYSGEPLPLLVSAMNKAGALTLNYSNALGLSEAVTLAANDKTGAAFAPAPGALSSNAVAASAFTNGVASVKPAYAFSAWPGSPTQIRLRATNGKAAGLDVSSAAPASAEEAMPAIRTGRLRLGSRFGGLKTTLSVPVTAEYWTGRSWLLNSDDNHTLIPKGSFAIKPTVSGMAVTSTFAAGTLKLTGGATSFDLRVTAGGPGPIDLAVNLGGLLQDNACINGVAGSGLATTSAAIPWLRPFVTGCNTSQFRDPSGRLTFGVYTPEDRRLIHVREVFN
jgi:MSHA biogenesis protein MshQ